MSSDPTAAFDRATAPVDPPMLVVTATARGLRAGCLVGFATQCSISPRRYLVCISRANHTHAVAARAATLAVHLLDRDQRDLAELFGGETGDDVDKFARCAWRPWDDGTPVLTACRRWFVGRITGRSDAGDHVAYVLEPVAAHAAPADAPLLRLADVRDIEPGHPA